MNPIVPRLLSTRLLRLRASALETANGNMPPGLLNKQVSPGKYHLLGRAWKYYYSHSAIDFTADDLIPAISRELPPGWMEFNAELIREEHAAHPAREKSPWDALEGLLMQGGNHSVPGYDQIIREGFPGRLDRIRKRLAGEADPIKRDFLSSMAQMSEGFIIFFRRCAETVCQAAELPANADRAPELRKLAEACIGAANGPARNFREALMIHFAVYHAIPDSPGCLDRYLERFYQQDLGGGELDEQTAFDYICAEFIQFFRTWGSGHQWSGATHMALGGRLSDGTCAVGNCTELCMAASASLKMIRPQIALRWSSNAPDDFLLRGMELLRENNGSVDFSNDEIFLPALANAGIAPADAPGYSPSGCNEVMIPGMSQMGALQGHFNLPVLLNILFGQKSLSGLRVPELESLTTFAQFRAAFRELQGSLMRHIHRVTDFVDQARAESGYLLSLSLFTEDCIDRGLPVQSGGARYTGSNYDANGIVNLADSMYVIRKLVYDEKRLTLKQFAEILRNNWRDADALRNEVRFALPHFGNDDPSVDDLAGELFREAAEDFDSEPPMRGGHYNMGTLGGYENAHVVLARTTGATPDGRLDGDAFASGLSPMAGCDRSGPTAMLNSICKIPFDKTCTSTIVNQMLPLSMLESAEGRQKAAMLLEAYFRGGGIQLQITAEDRETLLAAEKNPEKFPNLMVRVSGYSARFMSLEPDVRAEIVRRTI